MLETLLLAPKSGAVDAAARAAMLFTNPARAMRELAPAFKRQEASMETAFWNSRYVRQ